MSRIPLHSNFFSSLKQVEKRLKLDNPSHTTISTSLQETQEHASPSEAVEAHNTLIESLSSPLHLYAVHEPNQSSILQDSEPPSHFLSDSNGYLPMDNSTLSDTTPSKPKVLDQHEDDIDDIELLIQLLGLTDLNEEGATKYRNSQYTDVDLKRNDDGLEKCCCGSFYEKIVGLKGPKCGKEVQRLDGWIRYCSSSSGKERKEPLRLAHLLLGKAASLSREDGSSEWLLFPSTVKEFLQNDPPSEYCGKGEPCTGGLL
ncbi:hypothetical protein Dimus_033891 [Dionaea muscipula]